MLTDELGDLSRRSDITRVTVVAAPSAPPASDPAPPAGDSSAIPRPLPAAPALSGIAVTARCVGPDGWLVPRPPLTQRVPFFRFRLSSAAAVRYRLVRRAAGRITVLRAGTRRSRAGVVRLTLTELRSRRSLQPGAYALRLQALSRDGEVVDRAVARFRVHPHCGMSRT